MRCFKQIRKKQWERGIIYKKSHFMYHVCAAILKLIWKFLLESEVWSIQFFKFKTLFESKFTFVFERRQAKFRMVQHIQSPKTYQSLTQPLIHWWCFRYVFTKKYCVNIQHMKSKYLRGKLVSAFGKMFRHVLIGRHDAAHRLRLFASSSPDRAVISAYLL